jgi:DnaJ-class molecular chaperone
MSITRNQQKIQQAMNDADRKAEQPTCPTCGGTGTYTYTWSISATSKGTATVRCLACTEKPDDPWKFHS